MSLGHQLPRVLITQLAEVERAAPGDVQRFVEQCLRIQIAQGLEAAQMALAIGVQAQPGLGHRQVMADCGHGVLQGAPPARVHMYIAAGHRRDPQLTCQRQQPVQPAAIVLAAMQLDRQPQPFGEGLFQPATGLNVIDRVRHPQHQQSRQRFAEVFPQHPILAFLRAASGSGNQSAQGLVALEVFDQQHQFRTVLNADFVADDQRQVHGSGCLPGADNA